MMQTLDEIRNLSCKIADKRTKRVGNKTDITNILDGLEGIASRLSLEIRGREFESVSSNQDQENSHNLLTM